MRNKVDIKSRIVLYTIFVAVLMVSGCCKPGIRPEEANIFQAACGITGGDFDKQLDAAHEEKRQSEANLKSEQKRVEQLQTKLADKQMEHARLLEELGVLEQSSRELEDKIKTIRTATEEDKILIGERLSELNEINSEMERLKLEQGRMTNDEFQRKLDSLRKEVEVLRRISIEQ